MSKAVLVMDMPKACRNCRFCCEIDFGTDATCYAMSNYDGIYGIRTDANIDVDYWQSKPDWCPLNQIPEKKPEYLSMNSEKGYCDGWNACIDAIGGGHDDI